MSAAVRVGLFAALLALGFGGAYAVGSAVDPDPDAGGDGHAGGQAGADASAGHRGGTSAGGQAGHGAGSDTASKPGSDGAAGRQGLRLIVERGELEPGRAGTLVFRVVDEAGRTVEDFDVVHERAMHALAVREDLTGYRHVHPRRRDDGAWTVDVTFAEPGPYRLYADFSTGGEPHTLSAPLRVEGDYRARPLPPPAQVADAGDGYAVAVRRDGAGRVFTVTRDGRPVTRIEPYLGARGHLVAVRAGDLAFQHVHPRDAATAGREIAFDVDLERAGAHRLFLQFKHDGKVRTVAFTERGATADAGHERGEGSGHGGDHDH